MLWRFASGAGESKRGQQSHITPSSSLGGPTIRLSLQAIEITWLLSKHCDSSKVN